MFYSALFVAATAFTGLVSAQYFSTSGPLAIDPNSVNYTLRQSWCRAETNSCPQICGGQASTNLCDPNTLNYTCTCTNGNSPNISSYDQTIPTFVCGQWRANCVLAHPDLTGQTACLSVICGTLNASSASVSSSSSSASSSSASGGAGGAGDSASATPTGSGTGSAATDSTTSATPSPKSSSGTTALNFARNYGTGALIVGLAAVFGLLL